MAGNQFQLKRTSVSGRLPDPINTGNTSYIEPGELAINLTDKTIHSSNGTAVFEIGEDSYPHMDSAETITGEWTFSEEIRAISASSPGYAFTADIQAGLGRTAGGDVYIQRSIGDTRIDLTTSGVETDQPVFGNYFEAETTSGTTFSISTFTNEAALAVNGTLSGFTFNNGNGIVLSIGANGDMSPGGDISMGGQTITETKIGNWDTAFSWGDHDGLYLSNAQDTLINDAGGAARFYFNSFGETLIFGGDSTAGIVKIYRDDAATNEVASFGTGVTFSKTTAVNAEFLNVNYNSAGTTIQPDGDTKLSFGTSFDIDRHTGSGVYENVMSVSTGDVVFQNGPVYVKDVLIVDPASGSSEGGEIALRDTDSLDGFRIDVTGASSTTDEKLRIRNVGAGSEFVMDRDGNIGIGTGSPAYPLDISDTGASNIARFRRTDFGAGSYVAFNCNAGDPQIRFNRDGDDWVIGNDATKFSIERASTLGGSGVGITIDASGNTGIGTANPQGELHVESPSGRADVYIEGKVGDADGALQSILWSRCDTALTGIENRMGGLYWRLDGSTAGDRGGSLAINLKADNSSLAEVARFSENGNVGIGTSSPASKLHVTGGSIAVDSLEGLQVRNGNALSYMDFDFPELTTENANIRLFRDTNTLGSKGLYFYNGDGTSGLAHYISESQVQLCRSSGKVGIGTTNPQTALDVNGFAVFGPNAGGQVGITTNDGYGNASLCFNHTAGVPDRSGSSCRIETSVDSTTGTFQFEIGDSVTSGTAVNLSRTLFMSTTEAQFDVPLEINNTTKLSGHFYSGTTNPSNTTRLNYDGHLYATDMKIPSDRKLKKNIKSIGDEKCFDIVMKLKPRSYNWKEDGRPDYGLIAQEVHAVDPLLSSDNAINYGKLVTQLIGAIHHQQKQIDELKSQQTQIDELKRQVTRLMESK